jgi:hypothetical protein
MKNKSEQLLAEVVDWEQVTQAPHFEKMSFRRKGKIFLTVDHNSDIWCVRLTPEQQDLFCLFGDKYHPVIYPVPNKWGKQGWTYLRTSKMPYEMLADAVLNAWQNISLKK